MKHLFFTLFLSFVCVFAVYGQDDTVKPLFDTEVERKVAFMDIEGNYYKDVVVNMKSNSLSTLRIKVKVIDSNGKTIWKKTLKNSFLYYLPKGEILIGLNNFFKLYICKSQDGEVYLGEIREKEGVF